MQEIIDELTRLIFSDAFKDYGGVFLLLFGVLILIFSRNKRSTMLHANNGGVIVNNDNLGNINTGPITTNKNQDLFKQQSRSNKVLSIVGTGVSIVGGVITICQFLIPYIEQNFG